MFFFHQDGYKEDNIPEESNRNDKSISVSNPGLTGSFNPNKLPAESAHLKQVPLGSIYPKTITTKPPNPVTGYSNQWTVSGEKKPMVDPSHEAAKYWQRLKSQGFAPKPGQKNPDNKDQHAVESHDEFSQFDHHFVNFPTFKSEHSIIYDPQPPIRTVHYGPPITSYEGDQYFNYEPGLQIFVDNLKFRRRITKMF